MQRLFTDRRLSADILSALLYSLHRKLIIGLCVCYHTQNPLSIEFTKNYFRVCQYYRKIHTWATNPPPRTLTATVLTEYYNSTARIFRAKKERLKPEL